MDERNTNVFNLNYWNFCINWQKKIKIEIEIYKHCFYLLRSSYAKHLYLFSRWEFGKQDRNWLCFSVIRICIMKRSNGHTHVLNKHENTSSIWFVACNLGCIFKAKCKVHLPLEILNQLHFQVVNILLSRKQSNFS